MNTSVPARTSTPARAGQQQRVRAPLQTLGHLEDVVPELAHRGRVELIDRLW